LAKLRAAVPVAARIIDSRAVDEVPAARKKERALTVSNVRTFAQTLRTIHTFALQHTPKHPGRVPPLRSAAGSR